MFYREPWQWKEKVYLVANEPGALASFSFDVLAPVLAPETPPIPDVAMEDNFTPSDPDIKSDQYPEDFESLSPSASSVEDRLFEERSLDTKDERRRHARPSRQLEEILEEMQSEDQIEEADREEGESEKQEDVGRVMIGYQRSAVLGLGSVWCWVDDDRDGGKMIEGYWQIRQRNMGM